MFRDRGLRRSATAKRLFTVEDWAAGSAGTALNLSNSLARATITSGSNPRISRRVTGLVDGATYRVQSTVYKGTSTQVFFRVSATQALTAGDYLALGGFAADTVVNSTFVAPVGGVVFVGIVGSTTTIGQFVETSDHFDLSRE